MDFVGYNCLIRGGEAALRSSVGKRGYGSLPDGRGSHFVLISDSVHINFRALGRTFNGCVERLPMAVLMPPLKGTVGRNCVVS